MIRALRISHLRKLASVGGLTGCVLENSLGAEFAFLLNTFKLLSCVSLFSVSEDQLHKVLRRTGSKVKYFLWGFYSRKISGIGF